MLHIISYVDDNLTACKPRFGGCVKGLFGGSHYTGCHPTDALLSTPLFIKNGGMVKLTIITTSHSTASLANIYRISQPILSKSTSVNFSEIPISTDRSGDVNAYTTAVMLIKRIDSTDDIVCDVTDVRRADIFNGIATALLWRESTVLKDEDYMTKAIRYYSMGNNSSEGMVVEDLSYKRLRDLAMIDDRTPLAKNFGVQKTEMLTSLQQSITPLHDIIENTDGIFKIPDIFTK